MFQISRDEKHNPLNISPFIANQNGKAIDALTGRRIIVSSQNGFSAYKEEGAESRCNQDDSTSTSDLGVKLQFRWTHDNSLCHKRMKTKYDKTVRMRLSEDAKFDGQGGHDLFNHVLKTWTNPVFGVSKDKQLEAQVDFSLPCKQRGVRPGANTFSFSREYLQSAEVIGQVDNKFIACSILAVNESVDRARLLVLVDQHAAHERIRLEQLQNDFLQGFKKTENGLIVDCKDLAPPLALSLSLTPDCSLRHFKDDFKKIGIQFTVQRETVVENRIYVDISVSTMPTLFVGDRRKAGQMTILEESTVKQLFYDHIEKPQEMVATAPVIPPAVNNVLCSYACHSAIRFGDRLTMAECKYMIKSLAKCRLPFQCAHGRPSIAPLINLTAIS